MITAIGLKTFNQVIIFSLSHLMDNGRSFAFKPDEDNIFLVSNGNYFLES